MSDFDFFENLNELSSLADAFDPAQYRDVPADWVVLMTDVVNSTEAIRDGRYKEVNVAGAVAVVSVSNLFGHLRFPYVFGGDGATMLVPPVHAASCEAVLHDTATTMQASFGLEVRVGAVAVRDLIAENAPVRVARIRLSERYVQAALDGTGVALAEEWLKSGRLERSPESPVRASTAGFSCRWDEIPSTAGETVALIVEALDPVESARAATLQDAAGLVDRIIGSVETRNPVAEGVQRHIRRRAAIDIEAAVHARGARGFRRLCERVRVRFELRAHALIMLLRLPVTRVGKYLPDGKLHNIVNADVQKFDGRLKMVIACSTPARMSLEEKLSALEAEGRIRYGIHVTDRAIMTCLIHAEAPEEVHFVDAADGGYAQAAIQLKAKTPVPDLRR
ncbi:MAG: DUF3095 family protein [Spirochaetaceae bacterium]|nr:MAG: DUF3095 family protein [Spirochaetaceae bacterium]